MTFCPHALKLFLLVLASVTVYPEAKLISYWKFDGNSNDETGANNAPFPLTYAPGKYGQGVYVKDAEFYTFSSPVGLPTAFPVTLTAWVKKTATTNMHRVLSVRGLSLHHDDSDRFVCTSSTINAWTKVLDTAWHHVACTFTSTNVYLYIDGSLMGQKAGALSMNSGLDFLGTPHHNTGDFYVDDLRYYNSDERLNIVPIMNGLVGTYTPTLTLTSSVTVSTTPSLSRTHTLSGTKTATAPLTPSSTHSESATPTRSVSVSVTLSSSKTSTRALTPSATPTATPTRSLTQTLSPPSTHTTTPSLTSSPSETTSRSPTLVSSPSPTLTQSSSTSLSTTLSASSPNSRTPTLPPPTPTPTLSASASRTPTRPPPTATPTLPPSPTPTALSTPTPPLPTPTPTIRLPLTPTPSFLATATPYFPTSTPSMVIPPPPTATAQLPLLPLTSTITATLVEHGRAVPPDIATLPGLLEATSGVAVLGLAFAGAAAPAATKLGLIVSLCVPGEDKHEDSLPFILHPLQIKVAGSAPAGALVGNLLLCLGFAAVLGALLVALLKSSWLRSRIHAATMLEVQSYMRFPSAALIVFVLLYQGTVFASLRLIAYPPLASFRLLGLVGFALCIAVPSFIFLHVRRSVPRLARYRMVNYRQSLVAVALLGKGEWVSTQETNHWVHRYSSVFKTYAEPWAWFLVVEFVSMVLLAFASFPKTPTWTSCGHVRMFSAIIFLALLVAEGFLWPHARPRDNIVDFILLGMQGCALFLIAVCYYKGDPEHTFMKSGRWLLDVVAVVVLARVLIDMAAELYVIIKRRRLNLQQLEWAEGRSKCLDHELLVVPSVLSVDDKDRAQSLTESLIDQSGSGQSDSYVGSPYAPGTSIVSPPFESRKPPSISVSLTTPVEASPPLLTAPASPSTPRYRSEAALSSSGGSSILGRPRKPLVSSPRRSQLIITAKRADAQVPLRNRTFTM